MTVKELIEYLKTLPQDARCVDGEMGGDIHPTYSRLDKKVWF